MPASPSRSLKHLLSTALARLARRPRLTPEALRALRPARILIVRQHNQMGDMVCATPAFRAIAEAWPAAEIALVTAPVNREVVEGNPHLGRIITFDRRVWRSPVGLTRFLGEVRRFRPELAFVLSSVSFSMTSAWIAMASGARHVVGADSRPFGWDVSRHAFSLELPSAPEMTEHAVAHNLTPLAAVGLTPSDSAPVVVPTAAQTAEADRILAAARLRPGFWALHPGAGKRQNIWPPAGFADLARRARAVGHQVLILHGPADREPLADLRRMLAPDLGPDLQVAPACPVGVGAALLQRADRFLCNDTGVMHVAGALRVPTVALFGPTDPALWQPPAPELAVVRSPGQAPGAAAAEDGWMETIDPNTVWQAWQALPGRSQPTRT